MWDLLLQPLSVGWRRKWVVLAVPEPRRLPDRGDVNLPLAHPCHVVPCTTLAPPAEGPPATKPPAHSQPLGDKGGPVRGEQRPQRLADGVVVLLGMAARSAKPKENRRAASASSIEVQRLTVGVDEFGSGAGDRRAGSGTSRDPNAGHSIRERAAQARANGPPPDWPTTAKRSMPVSSMTARASSATEAR